MTALLLIRHAKSDWGAPDLDDHDRPLNARGERDAPRMAARLAATGIRPDRILSSTALRARTTAAVFADVLAAPVTLDPDLYLASASTLLSTAVAAGVERVAIVAHDPGLSVLASRLSDGRIGHMPTCAVAVFTWDTDDWDVATALDPTTCEQLTPRD